jgi:taurine--2-oxoglutarate transaminase
MYSWSATGAVNPLPIVSASGIYMHTAGGQRILDFNSQLMSVNIGHGDRRVIDAITAQATKLQYVQPAFATESRARLGLLAEILPGDLDKVFLTLGGAEGRERDQARPPLHRPEKILARYRATTGRRSAMSNALGKRAGIVGVVRYPDTHRWGSGNRARSARRPGRGRHRLRRRPHDRCVFLETSSGRTASSSRLMATSRASAICDRHGS